MLGSCRTLLGFCFVLVVTAGCRPEALVAPVDVSLEARAVAPTPPVRTTVSVRPRTLVAGEPIHVEVTVTNHSSDTVRVRFASGCQLLFEFRDSFGRRMGPKFRCATVVTMLELAPGQSKSNAFDWSTAHTTYPNTLPLRPGRYTVAGGLERYPGLLFRSEPVSVRLLPAERRRFVPRPSRI